MIGKIGKGKGFAGLTKYILEKEEAELLCTNLAGETPQDFYRQLSATRQLNKRVQSPVSHISLSFAPDEKPDKEQLKQIVEATLTGMGFDRNLYFAATHNDRHHFHLHIAASRINSDGECVSDWWDKRRLEKVERGLEKQFNLTPVKSSWEVNRTAPSTGQKRRMMREEREYLEGKGDAQPQLPVIDKIQDEIASAIRHSKDFTNYVQTLQEKGVSVAAKVTREGVVDGLRYEMEGVKFAASKLGHAQKPTIPGLQRQGINFELERDAAILAKIAYSNKKKDNRSPATIEKLIKSNPVNQKLVIPPIHHQSIKQSNSSTTDSQNELMPAMMETLPENTEPSFTQYGQEISSLLNTSESSLPVPTHRELWEKNMLFSAILELQTANTSSHPDWQIATFGERYRALLHLPTEMLVITDIGEDKQIRYAAKKGCKCQVCNFTEAEKQAFVSQQENSSQLKQGTHQQLKL